MSSASSDDKNMTEQQPIVIIIKTNKLTCGNQSLSYVSVLGASITAVSPEKSQYPEEEEK